jgi:hypothetical protein
MGGRISCRPISSYPHERLPVYDLLAYSLLPPTIRFDLRQFGRFGSLEAQRESSIVRVR